jgi:hypothetical protein
MNEETASLRFLLWAAGIALALSGTVSLTRSTYRMAEAAIEAQSPKNQLSYGQYSRLLWSSPKAHRPAFLHRR